MFNGRNQPELSDTVLGSNGFWGEIKVGDFQKQRSIPLQIPLDLVENALVYAIDSVELDLLQVEEFYREKGYQFVEQLPSILHSNSTGTASRMHRLFEKAVFARAKAELLPEFTTLSAREIHEGREATSEQRTLEKEATMAIRAIKGKKRSSAALI